MKRTLTAGAAALALAATGGGAIAAASGSSGGPGRIDDGRDLLAHARIGVAGAVAKAQTAASGTIGEIDLERYSGRLVFNVDVGSKDVKVDAATGEVVGWASDD